MKTLSYCLFLLTLNLATLEAYVMHHHRPILQEWKEENLNPFDELMISWNASRPASGVFHFYVSVKTEKWSPWLLYASWGSEGQSSFLSTTEEAPVKVYQDALEVLEGKKATAFQIKIVTEGGSDLNSIHGMHVYVNSDKSKELQKPNQSMSSIHLKVPGLSQMALNHPRHKDLCSPTSTTAVVRYLSNDYTIDPMRFAQQVWDSGFDIYGNWVFNVAQASAHLYSPRSQTLNFDDGNVPGLSDRKSIHISNIDQLVIAQLREHLHCPNSKFEAEGSIGTKWNCWVDRLKGFNDIYSYLEKGTPVIVSVRGPLPGSAQAYAKGHLLVVIGYDSLNQKVLCMDPAFPNDNDTHVSYSLSDFVEAWGRRGNVAYVFANFP